MTHRLWLVDHEYGAAIVSARSKEDAAFITDAIGDPLHVYPFNVDMAFGLTRERFNEDDPDETCTAIQAAIAHDYDCSDEIEKLLARHRVALDSSEFDHYESGAEGPPPKPYAWTRSVEYRGSGGRSAVVSDDELHRIMSALLDLSLEGEQPRETLARLAQGRR